MRKWIRRVAIILLWVLIWQIAAVRIDNNILLVGPFEVFFVFVRNMIQPGFLKIVLCSFARIGMGFLTAFLVGLLLGAAASRFLFVQELLEPVIQTLKSIPVASFVVLLLIWFGSAGLSFFISFLIVFPNVYVNTIAGLKSVDTKLLEMARVFGMGKRNRFFYIYRPALMPYLNSCLKISLGMSWKSGVAAEVIGLPAYSLGERLYMSKIHLDTAGLFAWTLTIILLSVLFEKAVLWLAALYEKWKPYPKLFFADKSVEQGEVPIKLSHINISFGEQQILRDYNFMVERGQRYFLMAPSGAGKTTILRIIAGLSRADSGTVTGVSGRIGMVFQEDRLCEEYDAISNIMLGMGRQRMAAGNDIMKRERIIQMVWREAVQILPEDCLRKPVKELSGGMRRRVVLLRAVLSSADILLLDEPFSGLDEENRARSANYLLARLKGRTLLVTTHREEDVKLLGGINIFNTV